MRPSSSASPCFTINPVRKATSLVDLRISLANPSANLKKLLTVSPHSVHNGREEAAEILGRDAWDEIAVPEEHPKWDFTTPEGQHQIHRYQDTLFQGIKAGSKKPMNMTKVSSVTQQPGMSPGDYYERLCEAYRIYTPFNPESAGSQ